MSIWNFISYREYLMEKLGPEGSRTGLRKKLAHAIPVHTTFVSQVLKGRVDFSLEQAESINSFFEHTEDESEYFLLLVLKDRSATEKLKNRFQKKITSMRDERNNIRKRLEVNKEISERDRERFYSSFIYGAIHVLTAIPNFQSIDELANATKLPRARIKEITEFMLRIGVLKEDGSMLKPGSQHVHLGNESELVLKHHSNWRFHTIANLQFLNRDDLHYSACLSLSVEDARKIKESILENLKGNMKVVEKSPEEVAYVMSFDFYKLIS